MIKPSLRRATVECRSIYRNRRFFMDFLEYFHDLMTELQLACPETEIVKYYVKQFKLITQEGM